MTEYAQGGPVPGPLDPKIIHSLNTCGDYIVLAPGEWVLTSAQVKELVDDWTLGEACSVNDPECESCQ